MDERTVKPDGEKIKQLRQEFGWSQEHLAEATELSVGTIRNIESGKSVFPATLGAIAVTLKVAFQQITISSETYQSKLAAIFYADVAGYSRLTEQDEIDTHHTLSAYLDLLTATIESHSGHVVHFAGDAILAEFDTVSNALACAVNVQQQLATRNEPLPEHSRVQFRIGINLGDVIVDRNDIYGNGVNIAARLESFADPGGICISDAARLAVGTKLPLEYEFMGEQQAKNIAEPVRAYRVLLEEVERSEALPQRMPFDLESSGEPLVKGFDEPVRVRPVRLQDGAEAPAPEPIHDSQVSTHWPLMAITMVVALAIGTVIWFKPWQPDTEPASVDRMVYALPDKPSIAVLPFVNLSGDPEQDYFVDGFTNAIITNLSKFPELFVIASHSVFTYQGKAVRVDVVGRELGVRYVLEGSLQRFADKVSVHAQLIEAADERHVWAEQYDVAPEKIFTVQRDLTQQITSTLAAKVIDLAQATTAKKDETTLQAYDLFLRASRTKHGKQVYEENIRLFERAIEIDPEFGEAYAFLSWAYLHLWRFGLADDPARALRRARESAAKAIALDQQDYRSRWTLGTLSLFADQDHDLALAEYEKAVSLNPSQADVIAMMSLVKAFMGRVLEAIELLEKAKRLNPYHPVWYDWIGGLVYYMARDYDEALLGAKKTLAVYPKQISARRVLVATYVEMGRMEEARKVAQEILEIDPAFRLSGVRNAPFQNQADRDRYFGALQKAGLPP